MRPRTDPDAARDRIVTVAEEQFRRVGYAKTAVSDIAAALGMSPANIYRFFASKSEINDAICARLMREIEAQIDVIVHAPGAADARLRAAIVEIHAFNSSRLTDERRLHDMVEVAMAENWAAIEAHCDRIRARLGVIIAQGIAGGVFAHQDPIRAGRAVYKACAGLFHPALIAQHAGQPVDADDAAAVIDLILAGLAAPRLVLPAKTVSATRPTVAPVQESA